MSNGILFTYFDLSEDRWLGLPEWILDSNSLLCQKQGGEEEGC